MGSSSTPKNPPLACARHPEARAVAKCLRCQAAICSECRRSFGYYVLAWREPPQLLALDGASGTALWKQPLEGLPGPFGLAAGSGHVCVSSRGAGPEAKAAAIVVSAQDGRLLWRLGPEHDVLDRPEMMQQGLVVASSDGLRMYRWSDGKEAWFYPIGLGEVKDKRKGVLGRTVEVPERLLKKTWRSGDSFFAAVGQGLLCLDAARGKLRWGIRVGGEVESSLEAAGLLVLSAVTHRNVAALLKESPVFVGSDQMSEIMGKEFGGLTQTNEFTVAVEGATGARRWAIPQGGRALGAVEGIVLCETRAGMALLKPGMQAFEQQTSMCLVDPPSGKVRWQVWREGGVTSPVIAGGAVVFAAASRAGGTIGADGQPKPPMMTLVAISLR